MSFNLEITQNNNEEIKRIVKERLQKLLLIFSSDDRDIDHAAHELRKNMKRVRAALRLVRDVTGKSYYKKENVAARDLARTAAELRKSFVMTETMYKLNDRFNPKQQNRFYPSINQMIKIRHQKLVKELCDEGDFVNQTVYSLHKIELEIEKMSFVEDGFDAFEKGLKRVYKRGRKAMQKAQNKPSTENFHEWRKRVKYLRYQLQILQNTWPEVLKGYIRELHQLSDLLGDDHDLYDFKNQLHHVFHSEEYDKWLKEIEQLIKDYSNEKRKAALELGNKIYAEKPKHFVARIKNYWETENEIHSIELQDLTKEF